MSIYRGPQPGFRGYKIERDQPNFDTVIVKNQFSIPLIDISDPPPGFQHALGGGLAFDTVSKKVYYSDGTSWIPVASGVAGTVETYSIIKGATLIVPSSTETAVSGLTVAGSATYHTITGWDLTTGIYTSPAAANIVLQVNLAWSAGVSNLGDRSMRIQYRAGGVGVWNTVKEVITQADPDINVETTQESQMALQLAASDQVRVAVFHNAPVPINVAGGDHTSISGFRNN